MSEFKCKNCHCTFSLVCSVSCYNHESLSYIWHQKSEQLREEVEKCKNETEERTKKEVEELKAFLRITTPLDPIRAASRDFTDVVLVPTGGTDQTDNIIPAHKAVLIARSPVFRAMLQENREMAETLTGTIRISDVSHDTLRAFVNYLYTAETSALDEKMARDLLVLGEKYDVKHLKSHCEKYLVSKLECSNSVKIFEFAHLHNADRLIESSLSVITDNINKLKKNRRILSAP